MREHHNSDDPDVIERELAATRARVDRTIDQIQERLSPGQLLDEGLRYFRDGPTDYLATFGSNLGHSVRDNPLPVVMIGLGVAWLALGQRGEAPGYHGAYHGHQTAGEGSDSLADRARAAAARLERGAQESEAAFNHRRQRAMAKILDVRDRAGETAADLEQRVSQAMEEASQRWQALKADMARRGTELRDAAADGMAHARHTAEWTSDKAFEIFEQQPILAAAAGVTVGALLGSLLPSTERESEVLGPYGEAIRREAETVGSEAVHAAKEAGRAAAGAAVQAVDRAVDELAHSSTGTASGEHRGAEGSGRGQEVPSTGRPAL